MGDDKVVEQNQGLSRKRVNRVTGIEKANNLWISDPSQKILVSLAAPIKASLSGFLVLIVGPKVAYFL